MQNVDDNESTVRSDGFTLIEIVIAMFLFLVLALSFLPVLAAAYKSAASNMTLAAASAYLSEEIDVARTYSTCSGLTGLASVSGTLSNSVAATSAVDPVSSTLLRASVTTSPSVGGTCPTYSSTSTGYVTVTISVSKNSTVVASASTLVFVTG